MNRQMFFESLTISMGIFVVALVTVQAGLRYMQGNTTYITYAAYDKPLVDEQESLNDPLTLDVYAKHIVSVNVSDPGCGCPSCCRAS